MKKKGYRCLRSFATPDEHTQLHFPTLDLESPVPMIATPVPHLCLQIGTQRRCFEIETGKEVQKPTRTCSAPTARKHQNKADWH